MFPCPNCGADVADGAISCKACGADAETGWKEDADSASPDLESHLDDERYDEFLAEDDALGGGTIDTDRKSGPGCVFAVIVTLLVAALIGWLVSSSRAGRFP